MSRGDQPVHPATYQNNDGTIAYTEGITIREELAARFMAVFITSALKAAKLAVNVDINMMTRDSNAAADAIIKSWEEK